MSKLSSQNAQFTHTLTRLGLSVELETLSCSARHYHIAANDSQSSLVLAVPIALHDDSGVAHVLEHLLLTGTSGPEDGGLFFRTRAESSAVDMNAVTNSKYLAVHFTSEDPEEYFRLLKRFSTAIFTPNWQTDQLKRETGDRDRPGIITNEMAGVFAIPEFYWSLRTYAGLFSAGSGQFNPGGDPIRIPEVDEAAVTAFWDQYFSTANVLVVSYGSLSPSLIRQELELHLSDFHGGKKTTIPPSTPITFPRVGGRISTTLSSRKIASGLLLDSKAGGLTAFDMVVLDSFFKRFGTVLDQVAKKEGLKFTVPPSVKEMDGDQFLFTLCTLGKSFKIKNIWLMIARICESVIEGLTPVDFRQLSQTAIYSYFSKGNEKLGTGIAASYELLGGLCGSVSSGPIGQSPESVDNALNALQSRDAWIELIDCAIRQNSAQVILDCEDDSMPIDRNNISIEENYIVPGVSDSHAMATSGITTEDWGDQISGDDSEGHANWLHPEVSEYQSCTLYHYRLPRPRISTLKISIALPRELGASSRWISVQQLPEWYARTNEGARLRTEAKVEAKKQPGQAGYQLILSLTSVGESSAVIDAMSDVCELLTADSLCKFKNIKSKIQANGKTRSLPPHKLAILRSASQFSDIAKAKLWLLGHSSANQRKPAGNDFELVPISIPAKIHFPNNSIE